MEKFGAGINTPSHVPYPCKYFFFFLIDRRNDKVIINSHTQVEVQGYELQS